ncbi:MAG: oligosaccharide flippase family protein [Patescibacteria group bacterium]
MKLESGPSETAPVSLLQKFVSGELQFGAWGVLARGLGWANSFLIISGLTVYQYGVFQLFLSAYAILTEFVSWGGLAAGTEILRLAGRGNEARAKRLFYEYNTLRFVSAACFWALFFFGAPLVAFHYGPDFIGLIRIMSFMFFAEVFGAAVVTVVNMRMDFRALASRRAIGKTFQLATLVGFFIFSTISLREVLLSLVIGSFLSTAILLPAAARAWKPWRRVLAKRGPIILWQVARAHGKWDSIKNLFSQFGTRIQPWLIKLFVSTEAVGVYGVATSLAEVVMQMVPRNTMNMLITKVFHNKDHSQRVFTYAVKYLTIWGIVGVLGSLVAVPVVIHFVLPQYTSSLQFFYLLVFLVPVKSFQWITDLFLRVFRQQKFAFIRGMTRSASLFVLLLVFLPMIGLWALALADFFMRVVIAYTGYRRLLKLRPEFRITPNLLFSFGEEDRRILGRIFENAKSFFTAALRLVARNVRGSV